MCLKKRGNTYFQVIFKDGYFDFSLNYLLVYVLNEPLSLSTHFYFFNIYIYKITQYVINLLIFTKYLNH